MIFSQMMVGKCLTFGFLGLKYRRKYGVARGTCAEMRVPDAQNGRLDISRNPECDVFLTFELPAGLYQMQFVDVSLVSKLENPDMGP